MSQLTEREIRQIPLTAMFIALAIILPQFFHLVGLGAMFLPMFLPVMTGSMLLTWRFALSLAIFSPLISWLITNMPPIVPPVLPIIIVELILVALIISLLRVHWGKSIWLALPAAIIIDRLVLFLIVSVIAPLFGFTHPLFSVSLVISGLPGIAMQLVAIPLTMRFIKTRFPQWYYSDAEAER